MLYFDQASTSFPKPKEVSLAITEYLQQIGASPDRGGYSSAKKASEYVRETRQMLADLFSIDDPNLVALTHNATHSLNLLIKGFLKEGEHVIVCTNAHNACTRPLVKMQKSHGISFDFLLVKPNGSIDLEQCEKLLKKETALVLLNHASNVTGVITPMDEVVAFFASRNVPVGVDVSQTAGIVPFDVKKLPVHFLVGTGHKTLLGPPGVGFFYAKEPSLVNTLFEGGSGGNASSSSHHPKIMPFRFEAGTLNYIGIAGLRASLKYCLQHSFQSIMAKKRERLTYLTKKLRKSKNVTLYGDEEDANKVSILSFNIPGMTSATIAKMLDEQYEIAVRAGLHCAPHCHRVLGTYPSGTVRLSLGHDCPFESLDVVVEAIESLGVDL